MTGRPPAGPTTDAGQEMAPPASGPPGRRVIAVLLLAAAALDIARCGAAVASAQRVLPAVGLVGPGLAAALLSLRTAQACESRRRWGAWAALAVGVVSGPQAAVSGFHAPYAVFDTATAALGILLIMAVLATAGRTGSAVPSPEDSGPSSGHSPSDPGGAPR